MWNNLKKEAKKMIGIILCCHGNMGEGVRSAAELIIGPQEKLEVLDIHPGDGIDDLKKNLVKSIEKTGSEGVVIFTDLPGGTPCNIAALLIDDRTRMISGFNLPLLIKVLMERHSEDDIDKLTENAAEYAREHVMDSSALCQKVADGS